MTCPDGPRGHDQVRAALIEAATDLFAERGPGAVSLREIAARAGVNYGLVHRHVGSKETLVLATYDAAANALALDLAEAFAESDEPRDVLPVMARHERFWRMLTRAILDGRDLVGVLPDHPILRVLLTRAATLDPNTPADVALAEVGVDVRVRAAAVSAAFLGWMAFGEQLVAAVGLEEMETAETHRRFEDLLRPVLRNEQPPSELVIQMP